MKHKREVADSSMEVLQDALKGGLCSTSPLDLGHRYNSHLDVGKPPRGAQKPQGDMRSHGLSLAGVRRSACQPTSNMGGKKGPKPAVDPTRKGKYGKGYIDEATCQPVHLASPPFAVLSPKLLAGWSHTHRHTCEESPGSLR